MRSQITKWGNSMAVRIPKEVLEQSGIKAQQAVEIKAQEGAIVIEPALSREEQLQQLVDQITPENRHELIDWGEDVGGEILEPYEGEIPKFD